MTSEYKHWIKLEIGLNVWCEKDGTLGALRPAKMTKKMINLLSNFIEDNIKYDIFSVRSLIGDNDYSTINIKIPVWNKNTCTLMYPIIDQNLDPDLLECVIQEWDDLGCDTWGEGDLVVFKDSSSTYSYIATPLRYCTSFNHITWKSLSSDMIEYE